MGLDAWLSARAAADQFSGVVLIRCGDQTVFSGAYGWATRRWAVPNTPAMRFDTAARARALSVRRMWSVWPGICWIGRTLTRPNSVALTSVTVTSGCRCTG